MAQREIDEISEEFSIDELESNLTHNIISKPKEFGKLPSKNALFMGTRYVLWEGTTNFSFGFIPKKTTLFEEISLIRMNQASCILDIDEADNRK